MNLWLHIQDFSAPQLFNRLLAEFPIILCWPSQYHKWLYRGDGQGGRESQSDGIFTFQKLRCMVSTEALNYKSTYIAKPISLARSCGDSWLPAQAKTMAI